MVVMQIDISVSGFIVDSHNEQLKLACQKAVGSGRRVNINFLLGN